MFVTYNKIIAVEQNITVSLFTEADLTRNRMRRITEFSSKMMKSIYQNAQDKPDYFRHKCSGNAILLKSILAQYGIEDTTISFITAKKYTHYFVTFTLDGERYVADPFPMESGLELFSATKFDLYITESKWALSYLDEPSQMLVGNINMYSNDNNENGWDETVEYLQKYITNNIDEIDKKLTEIKQSRF